MKKFVVIGAGLAGCECALVLAKNGMNVVLYEQKPFHHSPVYVSSCFSELVCSNSLRSDDINSAIGLLKEEMRILDSNFMKVADQCRIPAGKALAVDREEFAAMITRKVCAEDRIRIINKRICSFSEIREFEGADAEIVLAAGPLLDGSLAGEISGMTGEGNCFFYDAIAPIIWADSLDMNIVFRASRYETGEEVDGDYLNCPMTKDEYDNFYAALCSGKTFHGHEGENEKHFEGCMPIEALAARGPRTLTFGPMKPVGLIDPRTGKRPWAVLQLRPESRNIQACNLVGCQTKLLQAEQERIFRLLPGMENAEFARYGSMHRNTYVNAPKSLGSSLELKKMPSIHLAGQITGVEGYVESAASGLWLGLLLAARENGKTLAPPPEDTALGALLAHLQRPVRNFQPSNATFGLMPELREKVHKKERKAKYASRAESAFKKWFCEMGL